MGIMSGEFTFQLNQPLEYKFDGDTQKAEHVILKEPSGEHSKFYRRLKQMLTQASLELSAKLDDLRDEDGDAPSGQIVKPITDEVEKREAEAEAVYQAYYMSIEASSTVDAWVFQETFRKMACVVNPRKSVCMIDGRLSMTEPRWNDLHPDDMFEMAVRWCAFFAMPSIEGEKTTSKKQLESPTEQTEA